MGFAIQVQLMFTIQYMSIWVSLKSCGQNLKKNENIDKEETNNGAFTWSPVIDSSPVVSRWALLQSVKSYKPKYTSETNPDK